MVNRKKLRRESIRKEVLIPLLPNIITTGALTLGLASIMKSLNILSLKMIPNTPVEDLNIKFWWAAALIGFAIILDMLDGRVARALGSESRFGISYDSLSDLVSFGVAPGVLIYVWVLMGAGKLGLMALLFYIVCAALRLARFNIQAEDREKYHFTGLPSPMAAGMLFAPVMLLSEFNIVPTREIVWFYLFISPVIGIIMVSDIPYNKFSNLTRRGQFNILVIAAILISAIITNPSIMVTLIVYIYFIAGIVTYTVRQIKNKKSVSKSTSDFVTPQK